MVLDWLGNAFVALTLAGCVIMVAVIIALLYQLRRYLLRRPHGLALERQKSTHPLPPDADLPHVVVQIPSFNEGSIIERGIAGATRLDWPRDKLHIQVCDDSTDRTTELAGAAAQRAREAGFDVAVLHRSNRDGYKAGSLHEAMTKTGHGYFAILDVDYVPSPDFLRRCMPILLADPGLAFVQARIDFLNADENLLTRSQRIMLDYHYGLEQAVRSWDDQVVPFNGTCGVWRRAAIEAGGGWSGATVTEDMDLSYRAWLKGWRGLYAVSVTVPGELPTRLSVWMSQQRRWAAGIGEVAREMLPVLFGDRTLSADDRWNGALPLASLLGYVIFILTIGLAAIAMALKPSIALALGLTVYGLVIAVTAALFVLMRTANRFARPGTSLWRFFVDFIPVPFLTLYISWANVRALPATVLGRNRVFVRTPKVGAATESS